METEDSYNGGLPRRSRICPTCQTTGIPVMFGMPAPHVFDAVQAGRLTLVGCLISGDEDITWSCPTCEETFQGPDTGRAIHDAILPKPTALPLETS